MKKIFKILFFILLLLIVIIVIGAFAFSSDDIPLEKLKEKYTNEQSNFVTIDGTDVHYRIEGQGDPLVLIHGTAASLHTWDDWTNELRDSFRILRMDLPAFGLTGPNESGDYSMDYYVDFIHKLTNQLGFDKFHLAGNSLGGRISWTYALAHPQKVDKLILIDAAGYPTAEPAIFKIAKTPILNQLIKNITPRQLIEQNILEVYGDDSLVSKELVDRYYEMTLRPGNRDAFIDRTKVKYIDQTSLISNIKNETLIMWGDQDVWIPIENAYKFEKQLTNDTMIIYEGVGHVPMEEIPSITAKDAMSFLKN